MDALTEELILRVDVALEQLGSARSVISLDTILDIDEQMYAVIAELLLLEMASVKVSPAQEMRLWSAGFACHQQLAEAYITLSDTNTIEALNVADNTRCKLTAKALYHLGQCLKWRHLHYQAMPEGGWYQLHQLYSLAERGGYQYLPIQLFENRPESSIHTLYFQALMIDTLTWSGMTKRQIGEIFEKLSEWSVVMRLESQMDEALHQYVIDLEGDRSAQRIRQESYSPACRFCDTEPMKEIVLSLKKDATQLSPEVLYQLRTTWSREEYIRQRRHEVRYETIKDAIVYHGIYAVCNEAKSVEAEAHVGSLDVWQLENESYSGFLAKVSADLNGWLAPGKLIAVRQEICPSICVVGVVRSLILQAPGYFWVGVDILSHLALYGALQDEDSKQYFPGVYIYGDELRGRPSSLLIPAVEFEPNVFLTLRMENQDYDIQLLGLMEHKDDWVRVEIRTFEQVTV